MKASFGSELRRLRRSAGLNLAVLADLVGVSIAYVSQVERGSKLPPSDEIVLKWLKLLGASGEIERFRGLAARHNRTLRINTEGKSQQATLAISALARAYEQNSTPDAIWEKFQEFLLREGKVDERYRSGATERPKD